MPARRWWPAPLASWMKAKQVVQPSRYTCSSRIRHRTVYDILWQVCVACTPPLPSPPPHTHLHVVEPPVGVEVALPLVPQRHAVVRRRADEAVPVVQRAGVRVRHQRVVAAPHRAGACRADGVPDTWQRDRRGVTRGGEGHW